MNNPTDNKRIATTTVGIICLTIAVVLCCVATFAWFDNSSGEVNFPTSFGGSSIAAYFNGGDGSKNDPYQIDNPSNLYNLAWLQYLGYFNLRTGLNNGRAQTYFKLTASIDMSTVSTLKALPPIGTSEHPFIGYFDGNDKTVSNLNVSNKRDDFGVYPTNAQFDDSGMLTTCADAAGETPSQIEFVAMFGVVGDFNEWIANSGSYGGDSDVVFGDTRDNPAESPASTLPNQLYYGSMFVGNMYVDNLCVSTYTDNTLVGLAAGYVAGSLKNFGVYRSTINLAGGSKGTTLAKMLDGNGNQVAYGSTVSKFSIVGDYDTTLVGWTERPIGENDSDYWGGSVDMRTLSRRINYMMAKSGTYTDTKFITRDDNWGISARTDNLSSEVYWNPSSLPNNQIVYLYDGTVLPLNVDKEKMGLGSLTSTEITKSVTIVNKVTYHLNNAYDTLNKEVVKTTNTGYIVASGTRDTSTIRTRLQALAYSPRSSYITGIYKSLGYTTNQTADLVYDKTRFEMLTISTGGYSYRILDDVKTSSETALTSNGTKKSTDFVEYNTVRRNFDRTMEGSTIVHGFHFAKALPAGNARENVVSIADILQKNGVLIDRKYYTTGDLPDEYSECEKIPYEYEFVKGGLNFTLKKPGYITAILGAFYQNSGKESMFDLYEVKRTNGKITSLVRINNVYRDNKTKEISYDPTDTSGKTRVFSFDNLTKSDVLEHGCAYYFEIPVTDGDYVIGCSTGSSENNAYLMYLDIGANGGGSTSTTTKNYNIESVDFVNSETVITNQSSSGTSTGTDTGTDTGTGTTSKKYQSYADVVAQIKNVQEISDGAVITIYFKRDGTTTKYSSTAVTAKLLYYYNGELVELEFAINGSTSAELDESLKP